jgi:hypothetical protein
VNPIPKSPDSTPPNFVKPIPDSPDYPPPNFVNPIPKSPDSTPPNFVKPNSEMEKEIKGGDQVHYRGDSNPYRLWKVQHAGEKFHTIDTDDLEGLNMEDSIRVVPKDQVYSPEDFTYSVPYAFQPQQSQNPIPGNMPLDSNMYPSYNTPCDTQINFAPVIKVITDGNDMSSSSGPSSTSEIPSNMNPFLSNPNPLETNISNSVSSENKMGPIDFDKPIIIKKI